VAIEHPDNVIHFIASGLKVNGGGGLITGFDVGVARASVEGVKFTNNETAIFNPFTARHNVIEVPDDSLGVLLNFPTLYGPGGFYAYFLSNVSDNYIEIGAGGIGIYASHYPENSIFDRNVTQGGLVGLYVDGASEPSTQGNAVFGTSFAPFYGYWATTDGNVCTGCSNDAPFSPSTP
jgi:hypothetical protein